MRALDRILIVDDQPALCEMIAAMLDGLDLEPLCVHSDRAAYAALQTQGPFRALITDINLGPGTTGFDIGRAARQGDPGIAVVYVSGEAKPDSFPIFGVAGSAFLEKPFGSAELLEAIDLQLGRPSRAVSA